jgi:hypothetical protein
MINEDEKKGMGVAVLLGAILGVAGEHFGWPLYKTIVITSVIAVATAAIVMRRL